MQLRTVVMSAGNEGASGVFSVGAPSVGRGGFSVASYDNNNNLLKVLTVKGAKDEKFGKHIIFGSWPIHYFFT